MSARIQINAKADCGLFVTDEKKRPLRIAIIDDNGQVLAAGDEVATAIYRTVVDVQNAFWIGNGQMTVIRPVVVDDL